VQELLEPDASVGAAGSRRQYRGVTNEDLASDSAELPPVDAPAPVAVGRTMPGPPSARTSPTRADARSKDELIGGKPVRFGGPRLFVAAVLVAVGAGVGYWLFMLWIDFVRQADKTGVQAEQKYKGRPGKASAPILVLVPHTIKVNGRELGVASAIVGPISLLSQKQFLSLTLKITNVADKSTAAVKWPRQTIKVTVRDRHKHGYPRIEAGPQDNASIDPGQSIQDTLVFEPPKPNEPLYVDLQISDSAQRIQFLVPVDFIQWAHP
jgi:hypothetical protein